MKRALNLSPDEVATLLGALLNPLAGAAIAGGSALLSGAERRQAGFAAAGGALLGSVFATVAVITLGVSHAARTKSAA